ncbi:MAG: PilZ domain-containing protein [Betaproteobacteria bacterium]|jgi:hypothetical protein
MGSDKRSSPRILNSIDLECYTIEDSPAPVTARISDLSTTGAFLDCLNTLPVGTRLGLRFVLNEHLVTVASEVMHSMPQFGMGVRFLNLSPESRAMIESLLGSQR